MAVIGRGTFLLPVEKGSSENRLLRLIVEDTGIQLYTPSASDPETPFNFLETLTGDPVLNQGEISLVSLPSAPQAAFYDILLSAKSDKVVELTINQPEKFSRRANSYFKDLKIIFTQTDGAEQLAVSGTVSLILLGRADVEVKLVPKLTDAGLIFESEGTQAFEVSPLGKLTIDTLAIGSNAPILDDLQLLYSFIESADIVENGKKLDGVGFGDSAGVATEEVELKIEGGKGGNVRRSADEGAAITVGDRSKDAKENTAVLRSTEAGRQLSAACKTSQALTVAAWIKPTATLISKDEPPRKEDVLPARIVSLSNGRSARNFTLGQYADSNGANRYVVRLRRGSNKAENRWVDLLSSKPIKTPAATVDYVVFSYDATAAGAKATLYVNGEDQTERAQPDNFDVEFSPDFSGDLRLWDDQYPLLIGNEATRDRPWYGEIHQVAIYSRALSEQEIQDSYLPSVQSATAALKLTNVPAPLDIDFPVEIDLAREQLILSSQEAEITSELKLSQIQFSSDLRSLSGAAQITLWGNELKNLAVSLTENELTLTRSSKRSVSLTLSDETPEALGLGKVKLKALTLKADRSVDSPVWSLETDGQFTFDMMPPPLKGPFPAAFFFERGRLWLGTSAESLPLPLLEPVAFTSVDLRFLRDSSVWLVEPDLRGEAAAGSQRNGLQLLLFGETRSLQTELVPVGKSRSLNLKWEGVPVAADAVPADLFGKLHVTRLGLKVDVNNKVPFWSLEMPGQIPLRRLGQDLTASVLDFTAVEGAIREGRIEGRSELRSLNEILFAGQLASQLDNLVLTEGSFRFFPHWSPLQINGKAKLDIAWEDGRLQLGPVRAFDPAQIGLPDFELKDAELKTDEGALILSGEWLGKPISFAATQSAGSSILQGTAQFDLPFSMPLGRYVPAAANHRHLMKATVVAELSADGFFARTSGQYDLEGETYTSDSLTQEDLQLFAPPTTRNEILARLVPEAREFQPARGYFFGVSSESAFVHLGTVGASGGGSQKTVLPQLFQLSDTSDRDITGGLFELKEREDRQSHTLTISAKGTTASDLSELRAQYDLFIKQLDEKTDLVPGAIALVKARIAERMPLLVEESLYYHYGLDAAGLSLDLQPGMRLRVDYQNYQFVHPGQSGADSGYVGSGTSYYLLTSDRRFDAAGGSHVALDAFLSQLRPSVNTNTALLGAGGVLDTFQAGYSKPYLRLVYPGEIEPLSGSKDAGKAVRIVGADRLAHLDEGIATTAFHFRGRATVVPEIAVTIQGQSVFVPVGTTLRQVMEQRVSLPAALMEASLWRASGRPRMSRLSHEGISNEPIYRFVQLEGAKSGSAANALSLDLPLVKGDRIVL